MQTVETDTTKRRLVAEVMGRVQGVGFRYFVRTAATRLGITGWVRNDRDGSVLVEAEGPAIRLDQLLEALSHGPSLASVDDVKYNWHTPTGDYSDFTIRT